MTEQIADSPATKGTSAVPIGALPPLGEVPSTMSALVVRQSRFGDPATAFEREQIPIPTLGPKDVLIAVMAAGVNYNNVWAARGYPVDVIAQRQRQGEPEDYHVGGSDASGIVYAVGRDVTAVEIGAQVIVHPGYWNEDDPWIARGKDPMLAPTARIWGYDTNHGSFAQFARAQEHQVLAKASHLTWEQAAAPTLVGTTAYRMLHGWRENAVSEGDVVLVWGGSGGVGSQACQLVREAGGRAVAVVSDDERGHYAEQNGAIGYINRREFDHWGIPPLITDKDAQRAWTAQARAFGKKLWEIVGERADPTIVIEHPGRATVPTSIFVCAPGGMVVICAGTTGYEAMVDLRYHWTKQKRLQGSHGTNDVQAVAYNELVRSERIDPALGKVIAFEDLPAAHARMGRGEDVFGNTVALVGAPVPGRGRDGQG